MGFPRIIYGTNLDKEVDFDSYNRGIVSPISNVSELQSGDGSVETLFNYSIQFPLLSFANLSAQVYTQLLDFKTYARDGGSFVLEMDRDVGCYMGFENNVNTNDGTAGTFTRALATDSSYYVNPVTGLLTVVNTADLARFPAGSQGAGVLIEDGAQNLITDPSRFGTNWVAGVGMAVTTSDTTLIEDPAGGNNADLLTTSGTSALLTFTTSTAIGTDDANFSIWLRATGNSGDVPGDIIILDSTSSVLATTGITITADQWTKFNVSYDNPGSNANDWQVSLAIDNSGETFYAYGAQLVAGSEILFPTSTIGAVSTSSITRTKDRLLVPSADILNSEKLSIGFKFKPQWTVGEHPDACFFQSGTDKSNRHISMAMGSGSVNFLYQYRNAQNSSIVNGSFDASTYLTQDTFSYIIMTADPTIQFGVKIYIDGVLADTSANTVNFPPASIGTNFAIGGFLDASATSAAFGVFDEFFVIKGILNTSDILDISTNGFLSMGANRLTCELADKNFEIIHQGGGKYSTTIPCREVP